MPIQPVMVKAKTIVQKEADMISTMTEISKMLGMLAMTL